VEFFVAKVDAKLLKRVAIKDFKTVDVKDTDDKAFVISLVHEIVRADDDPVKQATVE